MRRTATTILAAALFALPAVSGAEEAPRFSVQADADGFVRIDTVTGAVSHCARREGVWRCEPFAEERAAVDTELARLAGEVANLSARLAALESELAALKAGAPVVGPLTPEEEKLERAMGFSEVLMRRFFGLVRELKRDQSGD